MTPCWLSICIVLEVNFALFQGINPKVGTNRKHKCVCDNERSWWIGLELQGRTTMSCDSMWFRIDHQKIPFRKIGKPHPGRKYSPNMSDKTLVSGIHKNTYNSVRRQTTKLRLGNKIRCLYTTWFYMYDILEKVKP